MTVQSRDVRALLSAFERLGWSRDALIAAANVPAEDIDNPEKRISCEAYGAIIRRACELRPLKNLAMRLATETPIGAYPLLDYLVLSSDTVGDGLHQLARYFRLVATPTEFAFVEEGGVVRVELSRAVSVLAAEYTMALIVFHLRRETGGAFRADRVSFVRPQDDAAELERAFECAVQSPADSNHLVMSGEMWRLPLVRRDPALRAMLEAHPEAAIADRDRANDLVGSTRRAVLSRVSAGDASLERVARDLATAPRTLQRKLAESGTTFQLLVDEARRTVARRHLADGRLSVAEVGYLLGYSEPAAFNRAFKRWEGVSPLAYRRNPPR